MNRVLIVEDDVWMGEYYERLLQTAGYVSAYVSNAIDAINTIDTVRPHVIVLDVFLAATNGLTLLHELQSYSDLSSIPVVVCTNNADELDMELLRPYGVHRLLDKTVMQPSDILAAVRSALL